MCVFFRYQTLWASSSSCSSSPSCGNNIVVFACFFNRGRVRVNTLWHLTKLCTQTCFRSAMDHNPLRCHQINSFWISQIWPVIAGCQWGRGGVVIEGCGWGSPGCWYMKWLGECGVFLLSCPLHCNYHSCSFCTTAPISPRHCNRDWLVRRPKQHRLKRHQTHIS